MVLERGGRLKVGLKYSNSDGGWKAPSKRDVGRTTVTQSPCLAQVGTIMLQACLRETNPLSRYVMF